MNYPVIDPVRTGANLRDLIHGSGNTVADVGRERHRGPQYDVQVASW